MLESTTARQSRQNDNKVTLTDEQAVLFYDSLKGTSFRSFADLLISTPIETLQWSLRARNCLSSTACKTLGDITHKSDAELMRIRNFGTTTLIEVKSSIARFIHMCCCDDRSRETGDAENQQTPFDLNYWLQQNDVCNIPETVWCQLTAKLKEANCYDLKMGELALQINAKWPANRFDEPLSSFLLPQFRDLSRLPSLGKKKINTILRCAFAACGLTSDIDASASLDRPAALEAIRKSLAEHNVAAALQQSLALTSASERELQILQKRYGLDGNAPQTLEQVGSYFGFTRERARQIQEKATKRLRDYIGLNTILKDALEVIEPLLFKQLSLVPGYIHRESLGGIEARLTGWEILLVEVFFRNLSSWLDLRLEKTDSGWIYGTFTASQLRQATMFLEQYLRESVVPLPLEVARAETGIPLEMLHIIMANRPFGVSNQWLCHRRLGDKEKRAVALHATCRTCVSPLVDRKATSLEFEKRLSSGEATASTICRQFGVMPDLFICCGSTYVARIKPKWETKYPEMVPDVSALLGTKDYSDEPTSDSEVETDEQSLRELGLQIISSKPVWRSKDLSSELVLQSNGRFAGASIGQVLADPRVQRYSPGLWGLKGVELFHDCHDLLLTQDDCQLYVQARYSRSDISPFPLWGYDMERKWCVWGAEHATDELYQSLLYIITPNAWECPDHIKQRWSRRQRELGRYRLLRPPYKALAQLSVSSSELLAALATVCARRGTSWMDLNVVHGLSINSHRSAAILALLIGLGAIVAARHWQEWHSATESAAAMYEEFCDFWIRQGASEPNAFLDSTRSRIENRMNKISHFGWVQIEELQSLISVLGMPSGPSQPLEGELV